MKDTMRIAVEAAAESKSTALLRVYNWDDLHAAVKAVCWHEIRKTVEWLRARAQAVLDDDPTNTAIAGALCEAADEYFRRRKG